MSLSGLDACLIDRRTQICVLPKNGTRRRRTGYRRRSRYVRGGRIERIGPAALAEVATLAEVFSYPHKLGKYKYSVIGIAGNLGQRGQRGRGLPEAQPF